MFILHTGGHNADPVQVYTVKNNWTTVRSVKQAFTLAVLFEFDQIQHAVLRQQSMAE